MLLMLSFSSALADIDNDAGIIAFICINFDQVLSHYWLFKGRDSQCSRSVRYFGCSVWCSISSKHVWRSVWFGSFRGMSTNSRLCSCVAVFLAYFKDISHVQIVECLVLDGSIRTWVYDITLITINCTLYRSLFGVVRFFQPDYFYFWV